MQHEFVFAGLEAARGAGSVLSVSMLLDWLDQLETGPEREATRAADRAALETLASRGIDSAERQHLRQLVEVVDAETPAPDSVGTPNDNEAAAQDSQATAAVDDIAVSPNSGSSTAPEAPAAWTDDVTFLDAVTRNAPIRTALRAGGYGPSDHEEGMLLLLSACPYRGHGLDPSQDNPARDATNQLHTWARTHFSRLGAAIDRLHPEASWIFEGLDTTEPSNAVLGVATLLERLQTLRHEAVDATLGKRGLHAQQRQELTELVATAKRATPPRETLPNNTAEPTSAAVDQARLELYRWYCDWSTTARTLVKRKDLLIRMGLARRRRGGEG